MQFISAISSHAGYVTGMKLNLWKFCGEITVIGGEVGESALLLDFVLYGGAYLGAG